MAAIRIYRRLQDLQDVDPNGLPQSGVPRYHTDVSSFVVETIAGGAGGSFSLGASTGGNTLGDTGVTGTRVVLAGVGNLTLSQATDANGGTISISGGTAGAGGVAISASNSLFSSGTVVLSGAGGGATVNTAPGGTIQISVAAPVAQTVQTQNRFNLTLDGNTAGALQEVSSGTLTLAGGNGITLSQNGNAVTISGSTFSQSVQPETQTFLGGVAASNTTYTSGTVSIVGSGIVTVQSGTGQRVIINASQSVQPETQTFVGGVIASDTTYTSGSVRFTGVGGGVTVSSNTGQRVDISVAAPVAQTGTQFSGGISGGNTAGDTGTVAGRLVLAGNNNITLSGSTNGASMTVSISGANAGGAQTGISGIANSQTTYTSGTVSLSELGAITIRSTTGNQFQLSVNAQTAESQSIGMSNIGNTSGTTGIASGAQVRMLFAGGNNVTLSQSLNGASGTITISAFNQSVQTQSLFSAGVSTGGNTAGDTGITGTRMVFVGSQNITLSQATAAAGGTITIQGPVTAAQTADSGGVYAVGNTYSSSSGTFDVRTLSIRGDGIISVAATNSGWRISASQSVQPETQTFVGGIAASNTTYTSGTITITGVGGGVTVSSNTGQRVDISVAAQSVESQSIGMSNIGNTSGTTGIASGGQVRFIFAGGNNVTLSQSLNGASGTITISAPNAQTGISGIANSQTTYTSGTVSMSELGAITIRSTTGNQYQFSVNAQTGTQFSAGISGGNTSGDTGTVAGRVVLAGGNNITLSGSTNGASETITISAGAGGGFSGGVSNVGNSSGDTGITGSRLVFAGGNSITLSQSTNASGGTITVSAPNASVLSAVAPLSTSTNGSTISILGPAQLSVGFSTAGNTSGDTGFVTGRLALVGSNGITLSGSTNAGSQTITISGITQSAESQSIGMSNLGNTSGTTGIASGAQVRMLFAGAGEVTLSQSLNGASGTITISSPVQTVESQSIGASNLGNTLGTSGVASGGQVRAVIIGTSNITVSQSVNGASATLSLIGQPSFSAGVSTGGNTGGATGVSGTRMVLLGSNNITLSQTTDASGNTVSIFGPAPGAAQYSIGASNLGNTAGSTGVTGTRIVFVGTNNLSLSQSTDATGATISFNNTVSAFQAGVSTGGNTTGDTGVTGTRMVFVGSSPITLSQATGANGGTISINAPATSSLSAVSGIKISTNGSTISIGYGMPLADWENMPRAQASLISHISAFSKTPIYWADSVHGDVTAKSLAFAVSMVTASQPLSLSAHLGVYSIVNSTSASLMGSVSEAYVVSSASSVSLSGVRNLIMTGIGTHATLSTISGGEYLLGMMFSATATNAMNASLLGASGGAGALGGIYPGTNQLSTGTNQGIQTLAGRGSVTVNAMPNNVAASDIINQGTAGSMALHPWIYIRS